MAAWEGPKAPGGLVRTRRDLKRSETRPILECARRGMW